MINKFGDFRDNIFRLEENEGSSKVLDLGEAIKRYVKPGMMLHIGDRASALARELIRQFYGSKPEFTLVAVGIGGQLLNLIHCGLVKKIITTSCSEFYPTPGPSRVIQRAFQSNSIEIENWSLLTLTQRLMAGAFDLPFLPTKSIAGSSMAQENRDSFDQILDPFGSGTKVGLVKALNPDVSLIHGWAADPQGNIIAAPYVGSGEDAWGAKANQSGVIATVEHIVSTQFIREHSALVTLPGYMVNSVALVPLGAHPQGMVTNLGISRFEPYIDDHEFTIERRQASRNPEDLDSWIRNWVLDCSDEKSYLSKVGNDRISFLKRKGTANSWKENPTLDDISHNASYNSREMMVIVAARRLEQLILNNGYKGILSGAGTSCLVSYLAYYKLKEKKYDV
ncbi:MAG: CoA-transferase, partial [Chloroflexota bacterium]|nr:CoA-transferase [Chloroflexota bacterium]